MSIQSNLADALSRAVPLLVAALGDAVRAAVRDELARAEPAVRPVADDLLDTRAAVRFTGRSASTLRRWRECGLPYVQTEDGGKVSYARADLVDFMRARTTSRAS